MSSREALSDIKEYDKLPKTEEKNRIDRMFIQDEISCFDFYCRARAYLKKVKGLDT
jgi:hypothetical protein